MNVFQFILSLIITASCYFGIPFIVIRIKKNKVSKTALLWIVIVNAIIFWFLFSYISISSGGKASNGAPTFLWSSAAYYYLKRKYAKEENKEIEYSPKSLPDNVIIGEDNLPKVINSKYKWGNQFNAFVITDSKIYHKYNCSELKGEKGYCTHIYNAICKYSPCPICKPRTDVDTWWKEYNGL